MLKNNNKLWNFTTVWNNSFEKGENREYIARDYLYASELGNSDIDLYLSLKGVKPTNNPNARALRKFEAGNYFEALVKMVLLRAGILKGAQIPTKFALEGCIPVSGRLDFIAGGKVDWKQASSIMQSLEFAFLPERTKEAFGEVINNLALEYPLGLEDLVLEVKSCSASMFEHYERTNDGAEHHKLQIFHYLLGTEIEKGQIVYVCRDDLRMVSIPIFRDDEKLKEVYTKRIERISDFYLNNKQPEKEKTFILDKKMKKIAVNWKIQYSKYLKYLYGFNDEGEFGEPNRKQAEKWNRTLSRIIADKPMTKLNLSNKEEIYKQFGEEEVNNFIEYCQKELAKGESETGNLFTDI